jgi:flagellar basal-body rod protein FlgG
MQNGYYSATGGMVTQMNRLDVISNNLANANTNSFKRDDVVVGDFMRYMQEYRDELPLDNHTKEGAKFLNRSINRVPHIVEQYTNKDQGALQLTGNALDFALKMENAFFLVETPNGLKLTRDGALKLNSEGVLSTKEGFAVLDSSKKPITINQESTLFADKRGNIYQDDAQSATLFIASYEEPKELSKDGDNYYSFADEAKLALFENGDIVANGYLEKSNINPVSEMVALIETNRLVEMYQKVMMSHMTDMNNDAITKLASIRA